MLHRKLSFCPLEGYVGLQRMLDRGSFGRRLSCFVPGLDGFFLPKATVFCQWGVAVERSALVKFFFLLRLQPHY